MGFWLEKIESINLVAVKKMNAMEDYMCRLLMQVKLIRAPIVQVNEIMIVSNGAGAFRRISFIFVFEI